MLSNENFLCAISAILKVAEEYPIQDGDVYISYLPLAHVFDRLGVYSCLSMGAAVGFFGGVILKIVEDLLLLRPSVFPAF
jgi:long-chain acyl-CoA synthetase